jgi:hypothetical protein
VDEPLLPGLAPGNPDNRLSAEARLRIAQALDKSELIRKRVLADIDVRYQSEPDCPLGFLEYLGRGQAFTDWNNALMEAARTVLQIESEEYRRVGLPSSEFRTIMAGQIDEACYSLELSNLQRAVLESEFFYRNLSQSSIQKAPDAQGISDSESLTDSKPVGTKPRVNGRPGKFAPYLSRAFALKKAGKNNNEIAKVLYQTSAPNVGQRNNVPKILKYHFAKATLEETTPPLEKPLEKLTLKACSSRRTPHSFSSLPPALHSGETPIMPSTPDATNPLEEIHYTPQELADTKKVNPSTIIRLFIDEPGVVRIGHPATRTRRQHFTLRIPASVAARVFNRLTVGKR